MTTSIPAGAFGLGAHQVEGPLKGYHHIAYAVRLPAGSPLAGEFRWLKLREPRAGVFWYDMRLFASEDQLLQALYGRVPRVPRVSRQQVGGEWMTFTAFIEGVTLDRVPGATVRVADRFLAQIEELFGALARIDAPPPTYDGLLACDCPDAAPATGSTGFLRGLVHFGVEHAYAAQLTSMSGLLAELGISGDALRDFGRGLPELTYRAPRLLHGDLHRKNFVVDRTGDLWTIDWELALFGDPLYDLATHLHLMGYRPEQEADLVRRWKRAVGEKSSLGADQDLPLYRTYKRLQSVYTDVVRGGARLREDEDGALLQSTAALVRAALIAAQEPLGMTTVPSLPAIAAAFRTWCASFPAPRRQNGTGCPAAG